MTQPQLDATSIEIRLSQARTAIRDGNYADAIALADRILEIEPDHQDAKRLRDDASLQHAKQLVALGMNAYSKESFEEAANLFDEAISYEKHNSGIERLINTERIREFLEESRQKQNLPEDLRLAHIALFAGDHMKALEMISGYQDALVVNFRNKVKQHQEASSALSKNDFVAALPLLEQINKEDPKASIVLENLPRARYHKALEEGIEALDGGDYPSAETKFRGALKHIPGDAKARELLEQARDHRGRREQISKILARAQETISRHHYQEAINLLEQAFKLEPSEKVAGKLSEARNLFNEDRRQQALALVQDGERLTASSELERAQEKFASALQLVSGLKEALLGQEKIKRLLGEREKADSAHRTALNYLEAGDFDGAEKELLTARPHASDPVAVESALRKLPLQRGLSRAKTLMAGRKYARVMDELEKIPREFSSDPAVVRLMEEADQGKRLMLAQGFLDAGDPDGALKITGELRRELGETNEQLNTIIKDAEDSKRRAAEGKDAIRKGKSALIANQLDAALSFFDSVMRSTSPDSQEYQEAYEGYNDALSRKYTADQKNVSAGLDRASQLLNEGNYEAAWEALEDTKNIIKFRKFTPDADTESRLAGLKSEIEQARARYEQITGLIAAADEKVKFGDYAASLAIYDQLLQLAGERPELRHARDRVAKLLNQEEGGQDAKALAVAALGKHDFQEAWKQTLIAIEYDPKDFSIQSLQNQIITQVRDLANGAFQAQDLENTLRYVKQWQSFWPFDPDAIYLEQRVNQEKSIRKTIAETLKKARKSKDPEERLRILDSGIAELGEHHEELTRERRELKARLDAEEEVNWILEITARYKETGYFGKAIEALEKIHKADPANRKVDREIERTRHDGLLFLQSAFQEVELKLAGGDFEGCLEHLEMALRATTETEERNRLIALKERVYRVQRQARYLESAVRKSQRFMDQKQYEAASQAIRVALEPIKQDDRQESVLHALIQKLDDDATFVDSQLRMQRAINDLVNTAEESAASYKYEEAIEALEQAVVLDPANGRVTNLLTSIKKKRQASDEIVRVAIENATATQETDVEKALEYLIQLPVYAQELPKVRTLKYELEYRAKEASYRKYMDQGNEHYRRNEYQEAMKAFESALNMRPADAGATNALASVRRDEQKMRRERAQIEIAKGKQAEEQVEYATALDHYREALDLDPENESAKTSYQRIKDRAQAEIRDRRRRRGLMFGGLTALLLIIGLPTFFAMGGPRRIAAMFPTPTSTFTPLPTPTFTATLTPTVTPTSTFTPLPTLTASPTFAAGVYPGTFYPVTTISYFPDPLLSSSPAGAWSGLFYICNRYNAGQFDSYRIAAYPEDCTTRRFLGWVNGRYVLLQFHGDFPTELTTPGP